MSDRDKFLDGLKELNIDIRPEQLERIDRYALLLEKWQNSFNLIGPETVPYIYERHILDSVQLVPLLCDDDRVVDVGAGAGLPSVVISIMTGADVYACERNGKKVQFLNEVRRQLGLKNFSVIQDDVFKMQGYDKSFSVVTSRAFSELKFIIEAGERVLKDSGRYVLLKGGVVDDEIISSGIKNIMTIQKKRSITSSSGSILIVTK